MGQGRFGHDRILSGVIMCHVVGNNGVFPERGSRGPCHLTGKPGEPCRPAPPPAAPSTRDSSTSTSHRGRSDAHKLPTPGRPAGLTKQPNGHTTWWQRHYGRHNDVVFASCVRLAETPAQQHSWRSSRPPWWRTADRTTDARKNMKKVDLHFMHDSRTWRQRTGVKTLSHPPTLQTWIHFKKTHCTRVLLKYWFSSTRTHMFSSSPSPAYGSTLVRVIACCLMAPSYYLNQYWMRPIGIELRAIS